MSSSSTAAPARGDALQIAHLSDLHLLSLDGVRFHRFLNKRLSGWANLRLRRGAKHRPSAVHALVRALAERPPDHVVVTGDLTNLALESEFSLARQVLEGLGLPADRVSIIPGNHDAYTRGAHKARRFEHFFAENLTSDLPGGDPFPFVRLRGAVAIIGLSSAVPRIPFVASGRLGRKQLGALRRLLDHPEVARRVPVVLVHHPPIEPHSALERALGGLSDAPALRETLSRLSRGLVLHGHLHRRIHRTVETRGGQLDVVGATSASLVSGFPDAQAGFNLYEIDEGGGICVEAQVLREDDEVHSAPVPRP